MRTLSGLGNAIGNQQSESQVIERAPEVVAAPNPITMVGVQAMIWVMMVGQREEMRQMLLNNKDEPTIPVVQPELNIEQSEEGNYSQTVSQTEPHMVRRNHENGGNDGSRCKYKDFMASKTPSFSRSPTAVEVMDWISRMEMMFESCDCSNK